MAAITTGSHPRALWPGVKTWFGQTINELPKEYAEIYEEETSDKAYELDVESYGFGLAVKKPETKSFTYDEHKQGYEVKYQHDLWGLGWIVSYEELQDNLYLKHAFNRTRMLAISLNQTKEINGALPFNVAFDGTGNPFADGAALCSNLHPTPVGYQSNIAANSADFSEAAVEDLAIQAGLMQSNRGIVGHTQLKKIVVHMNDAFNAARVFDSPLTTTDNGNAVNEVRRMPKLDWMVNHFFESTTAWFALTDWPSGGFKLYQREGVQFTQDNCFDTMNAKAKSWERYKFGISEWRGVLGSPGA